jgi:biotin transport system substrate-specific component
MNSRATTLAGVLRPATRWYALAYDATLVAGASLLIALSAQAIFRLPFSPVPVTGQTLAVVLVGALLGSHRGAASAAAYLLEGLLGWPVFAGGASGPAYVAGPTGGYLLGFIAAAYVTGWLAERAWDRHVLKTALAMLAGNVVIYACGLSWLAWFAGAQTLKMGLLPFIAGDVVKIAAAAIMLPAGWRFVGRGRPGDR